jgi:hypothetical protein
LDGSLAGSVAVKISARGGSLPLLAVVGITDIVAFAVWLWRRHKDRRKRAAALIGAKSRALRDAIVKRAKESARGARPVLRPIPGSAP